MPENGHNFESRHIDMESGEPTGDKATVELSSVEVSTHLDELEDVGHPMVPEPNGDYIMQEINGVFDIELLSYAVNDPDFFAMLEGEAGVGKNMSIDVLCHSANYPRVRVNFGIGTTYSDLVGRYAPVDNENIEEETQSRAEVVQRVGERIGTQDEGVEDPHGVAQNVVPEGSSFRWVDGLLTRAVKNGWIFVADEINAAEPEATLPLNGLTEARGDRYLTIEERSKVITPHPRFQFVATRNPITYAGTGDMNSALESRGYIIEYDYHEPEALKEIIDNRTNIVLKEGQPALDSLIKLVDNIRVQEQSGTEIVTKVSSRDVIKIGNLTDIMSIENAAKTVLMGVADPTDKESIRELIKTQRFQ